MYKREQNLAIAAVTASAKLCEQVRQANNFLTLSKPDCTPVTLADLGSQAVICHALSKVFPEDPIIAEENATILREPANMELLGSVTDYVREIIPDANPKDVITWINLGNGKISNRYWTLDPIDGTKGFIRGDQYAIALALIEDGEVKLGVLACPALSFKPEEPNYHQQKGVLFIAVKNQGTQMGLLNQENFQYIQVNSVNNTKDIRPIESVESAHSDRSQQAAMAKLLGLVKTPIRMDSQAKYGAVSRGEADFYLRIPLPEAMSHRENIWDHAAGSIIVTEAGGCVTDLDGKLLDFSVGSKLSKNCGIVVSNGMIHQTLINTWHKLSHPTIHRS